MTPRLDERPGRRQRDRRHIAVDVPQAVNLSADGEH